jgi:3'(2'), 5'-bisphosphate nucleotidase
MTNRPENDPALEAGICALALDAGRKALEIYGSDFETEKKADASPVTEADRVGEEIILAGLATLAPDIPVLAEESASEGDIPDLGETFFLVDPLDGTKEFITKTGEFTVNIALIQKGRPVLGVVYAPAIGKLYWGSPRGAFLSMVDKDGKPGPAKQIKSRAKPSGGMVAVASRSHRSAETDDFLKTLDVADFAAAGSSLKFCLIAEGKADIYPRFGRTMEWDTGAGQAVLEASGGRVVSHPDGNVLLYGKGERGYDNPHFIAWGAS